MKRFLPDPVMGALVGFALGFMLSFNLAFLGVDGTGWVAVGVAFVGAVVGWVAGYFHDQPAGRARTVARWCAATAGVLGAVSFLVGFAGPILLRPDLPQRPLLGIFCTGPLGALAGAVLGAVLGLLVPSHSSAQRH